MQNIIDEVRELATPRTPQPKIEILRGLEVTTVSPAALSKEYFSSDHFASREVNWRTTMVKLAKPDSCLLLRNGKLVRTKARPNSTAQDLFLPNNSTC